MPLTLENINKAREAGYNNSEILGTINEIDPEFGKRILTARDAGYDDDEIMEGLSDIFQSNVKQLDIEQPKQEKPAEKKEDEGFFARTAKSFERGLNQSASGLLAGNRTIHPTEDPGIWQSLIESTGTLLGDAPYIAAGATLGAALGTSRGGKLGAIVGGAGGSLAFPGFIKESLRQYHDYVDQGHDLTFGEFLSKADKIANTTLREGAFGLILGAVSKSIPLLEKVPGLSELLKHKAARRATEIGLETFALGGIPAIAEGRAPTPKDFATAFALSLGIKSPQLVKDITSRVQTYAKQRGIKLTNEKVQEAIKEVNLKGKSGNEIEVEIDRALNEVFSPEAIQEKKNEISAKKANKVQETAASKLPDHAQELSQQVESITGKNKKKLAQQAIDQGNIQTPEQLNEFLDRYEATYESIPGKTVADKNRKFMNRYSKGGLKEREVEQKTGEAPVSLSNQQKLEAAVTNLRQAKAQGDKQAIKDAQKKVDLLKRKVAREQKTSNAPQERENVEPSSKKLDVSQEAEAPKEQVEFTTSKGSTYVVGENGTTTRNKKFRAEHGEKEQGPQPTSEKTYYISKEDANKLSEFQAKGEGKKLYEFPDGRIGVMYTSGPNKGKVEARTVVTPSKEPQEGLLPVESWNAGEKVHFGNEITSVKTSKISASPKPLSMQVKPQQKTKPAPKPIVESTGKGAREQVDITKTKRQKLTELTNSAILAIKNPKESVARAGEIINENVFNYLAALERIENESNIPVEERPSTFIRRAEDASSTINAVLENGIFSDLTNQIEHGGLKEAYGSEYTWKMLEKDVKKTNEASVENLSVYRAAKQSLKRQSEGKITGVDTAESHKDVADLREKYEPIAKRVRQFQKDINSVFGKNILGKKGIENLNNGEHSSLYRVMDTGPDSMLASGSQQPKQPFFNYKGSKKKIINIAESDIKNAAMLIENAKKNEAILKYREGVENGSLPGKIVESKRNKIPDATRAELEAHGIDFENESLVENMYEQTRTKAFTPSKTRLRGWKDGNPFEIEVPQEVAEVFQGLEPYQQGVLGKVFSFFNRSFSNFLTLVPTKFASIWIRDAISAGIWSRSGVNPRNIFNAIGDVFYNNSTYKQFLQEGGDRFALRLATRMQRAKKIGEFVTPGHEGPVVPLNKVFSFFKKYNLARDKLGIAVPYAEYLKSLKKYGNTPTGRIKAMIDAKNVTYDPKARGKHKIIRELAPAINYLNVALQDIAMNVKNLKRPEVIGRAVSTVSAFTLALRVANEGNEDYDALSPYDKIAYWHLYFPGLHVRIATPWLLGTIFKGVPELMYETFKGNGKETSKALLTNFIENTTGSLNPLVKSLVEVSTGKSPADFLNLETKAPEVIPKRLQHLPKELQYTANTSQFARKTAPFIGLSPVMVDRLINNLGAGTSKHVLSLIDEIAYQTGLAEDKRPEKSFLNHLIVGNFLTSGPETRTKYANKFYEYYEEFQSMKAGEKLGVPAKDLKRYQEANLGQRKTQIDKKFHQLRDIENSNMNPREKKQAIQIKQQEINALFKEAVNKIEKR